MEINRPREMIYLGCKPTEWSNGWVDRLISLTTVHGESGDVDIEAMRDLLELIKNIIDDFDPENCDETELGFKHTL